jgi:uncharacterized protein (TIGR03435 family)
MPSLDWSQCPGVKSIPGKKMGLAIAAVVALGIPFAVGMMSASPTISPLSQSVTPPEVIPKWEAVSIKRCGANVEGGRRSERGPSSPDRLRLDCQTVKSFIFWSYVQWANGHFNPFSLERLTGGPAWIDSELYQIDAKTEGPQSQATLNGPMLETILEDRLQLKIHRETREVPVYALTAGKGEAKLQPFTEGSCIHLDFNEPPILPASKPGQPLPLICGMSRSSNSGYDLYGATMADFAIMISSRLDRKVIDLTGIAGMFNIHLDLLPAELGFGTDVTPGSPATALDASAVFDSIQSVIGRLGLKLEAAKGPGEFLVIDSIERPTEN